jgi:hypothetical protein
LRVVAEASGAAVDPKPAKKAARAGHRRPTSRRSRACRADRASPGTEGPEGPQKGRRAARPGHKKAKSGNRASRGQQNYSDRSAFCRIEPRSPIGRNVGGRRGRRSRKGPDETAITVRSIGLDAVRVIAAQTSLGEFAKQSRGY